MALKIKIGKQHKEIEVFCDMKNQGWTTIMSRKDGSVNFVRNWEEYKHGFGGIDYEIIPTYYTHASQGPSLTVR